MSLIKWYLGVALVASQFLCVRPTDAIDNRTEARLSPFASAPSAIPAETRSRDFTATVGGVDANNNEVRDDIEDVINNTYADSRQRTAMMQYARSERNALLYSSTREQAFDAARKVYRALDCIRDVFGKAPRKLTGDDVLAMTLNTRRRALAYLEARKLSSGRVYGVFADNPCDTPVKE